MLALTGRRLRKRDFKAQQMKMEVPPRAACHRGTVSILAGRMMLAVKTVMIVTPIRNASTAVTVLSSIVLRNWVHMPDPGGRNCKGKQHRCQQLAGTTKEGRSDHLETHYPRVLQQNRNLFNIRGRLKAGKGGPCHQCSAEILMGRLAARLGPPLNSLGPRCLRCISSLDRGLVIATQIPHQFPCTRYAGGMSRRGPQSLPREPMDCLF